MQAEKLSQELLRVKQKLSILNQSQLPVEITQSAEGIEKSDLYICIPYLVDMQFSIEDPNSIFSSIELQSPSVELQSHIAFLQTGTWAL